MKTILQLISLYTVFTFITSQRKVNDLFNGLYNKDVYSGWLQTDIPGNEIFYIFTPSQSASSPENDPIVLWLNGGPGCSSLLGLLSEIGPVVTDAFTGVFKVNEHSWNLNANVIYFEQPAGTGFSKSANLSQLWEDTKTATGLHAAMKDFYKTFPQYINNDFYITGESYAGVMIPNLAMEIINDPSNTINLKGVLVGNGITDFEVDYDRALVEYAYWHGLISKETWNGYVRNCPHYEDMEMMMKVNDYPEPRNVTQQCNVYRNEVSMAYDGLDLYGIYHKCPVDLDNKNDEVSSYMKTEVNLMKKIKNIQMNKHSNKANNMLNAFEPEASVWPSVSCGSDPTISAFLNTNSTKEKLGVDVNVEWIQCSNDVYGRYNESESIEFYRTFMNEHKELRVWFFSGENDVVVSWIGTTRWINKLNMNIKTEYKQWHCENQVAGFVQEYENGLVYVSVKGAGHMVGADKRAEAKVMFDAFIKGSLPT